MADGYDLNNISPELKKRLAEIEANKPHNKQITLLEDAVDMIQELVHVFDNNKKDTDKFKTELGSVLLDMRETIHAINKKDVELPDYAQPVVKALESLSKEVKKIELKPEFKPEIKVDSPSVEVPEIDFSRIEKILKSELPKAFDKSIKNIPKTEFPEIDFSPVTEVLESMSEQLESIDVASRMKPQFPTHGASASQPTHITGSITAESEPSFSEDPNAGTPVAKHGLVDANGVVQVNDSTKQTDALTDTQLRASDVGVAINNNPVLGAGTNIVGYVSSTIAKKVGESKFYLADSGQIATDATNNWMNITLENPAGSGKTLYLVAITIESDTAGWATMHHNPTTNLPTTAKTAYNAINLGTGSSMNVKADAKSAQMDAGTSLVARVPSLTPIKLELPPFVFTPGNTMGLGVNLGGVANASFAAYWYEE